EPVSPAEPTEPAAAEASTDPRQVVLALAARGPISGTDARAATGLSAARSRTLLQQLVAAGELVRTGATSATRWHLPTPGGTT
ncbi:hypothetical protein, partial [Nocardioides sp.]|uniref:hypothetical protein n=1 Tax=Nocardioides sp. TaxID=35761 RepID=UPI0025CB88CA